jgi:alkylhydroperoxidase family enzyme
LLRRNHHNQGQFYRASRRTQVRAAGFDDGAIAEVVANVALSIFTNYFTNVAETDIDFPKAAELKTQPALN